MGWTTSSLLLFGSQRDQALVEQSSFTDVFEFENGKISLVGVTLDEHFIVNIALRNMPDFAADVDLRPIAVLRGHSTIIPRGDTVLRINDHVYFITQKVAH
ncbi:MAG: TrkA C-terminal domain-containing protein [Saprospiraceae bacterium]